MHKDRLLPVIGKISGLVFWLYQSIRFFNNVAVMFTIKTIKTS